jgi:hypothetical protein
MAEQKLSATVSGAATIANEWSALLECASAFHDRALLLGLLRPVDWARLLVLAENHGVVGLLKSRLRDLEWDQVPPETKQTLVEWERAQVFSSLRMTAELFRILDRFTSAGIGALTVKGPVLAVRAYGDPGMRSYGDLDLLVRQRDIRRATELMITAGYVPAVSLNAIDAGKIPGQYLFSQPQSNLLVELHNDLTLRYFPRRLPLEDFFARQIRVTLDGREAPALALEDELVLICIHGAKHFWERLMWIADVAALVTRQTTMNWSRVTDSAAAVGADRMLYTGLRLAVDLLKAQLPGEVLATIEEDGVAAQLAKQTCQWLPAAGSAPPGLIERALFRMRMRGGFLSSPAYLLRLLFSPTEEDWHLSGDWLPRKVLDILRRPFRLARKYGRGGKS